MLGTGVRIGEAAAVRAAVLGLDAGTVLINATVVRVPRVGVQIQPRTKTPASRRILTLPQPVSDTLLRRRLAGHRTGPAGVLFPSPTGRLRDPSDGDPRVAVAVQGGAQVALAATVGEGRTLLATGPGKRGRPRVWTYGPFRSRHPPEAISLCLVTGAAKLTPHEAAVKIKASNPEVIRRINEFTEAVFRTRGGRMGSGMGLLLEGLWGYHTSAVLEPFGIEIAWIVDDQYNDYACVDMASPWDPDIRAGELLRIEAKTMNLGADEPKGHFAELAANIGAEDLLLVLVWRWTSTDTINVRFWPKVEDAFIGRALPLAELRDALHVERGGSFVDRESCPDGCKPNLCQHHGEPLNASGNRERLQGPESTRPSARVSFASNFGGLKRMLATKGAQATQVKTDICSRVPEAKDFVDFMTRASRRP